MGSSSIPWLAGVASTIFESVSAEVSDVRFTARAAVGIMVSTTDLWLESSKDSGKPDTGYFVGQVVGEVALDVEGQG
ncbi:TetR family transcriptional regulator [Rhodococcus opacus M213]|uniref:TetR family transcriptional regulator n=1 Tax=Rhodococcus opacus M213 TaxID=1129896 RepID=K8XT86_RHOOP|nr:hypothetical protein [Rhodococcus opacus]EKT84654.1 TetR family transcriptional regulator [Rhodococcus opacus M213]